MAGKSEEPKNIDAPKPQDSSSIDGEEVEKLGKKETPTRLVGAHSAFLHRIGFAQIGITPADVSLALRHPALHPDALATSHKFEDLSLLGTRVLTYFVNEYIQNRFPKLPKDSQLLAKSIFLAPKNLILVARSFGLEYSLLEFEGLPHAHFPTIGQTLAANRKKFFPYAKKLKEKSAETEVKVSQIMTETFMALLGTLAKHENNGGLAAVRRFLDAHLFSATFETSRLVKPKYPILNLTEVMLSRGQLEPTFRLLHESGRTSNSSMFVVGVFSGPEMLAEGYGPSLNVAEHRAATEALRKMFLIDVKDVQRPSDSLLTDPTSLTLDRLLASTQT